MVQRIFHPVGQGAFYSERHDIGGNEFNIVYDCGTSSSQKQAIAHVKTSFYQKSDIDILFISHFDFDHVSLIKTLKDNFKIKMVVLPLLHDGEEILINIYRSLGYPDISSLIDNPEKYFGEFTKIIRVRPYDGNPEYKKERYNEETNYHEEKSVKDLRDGDYLSSGTIISHYDWIFVPYNIEYHDRSQELENIFLSEGLDIDRFKIDIDYAIKNRSIIKKAYNMVTGRINQNSMLVYSGPFLNEDYNEEENFILNLLFNNPTNKTNMGCIYSGDADLNYTHLPSIFQQYWNNVGTIQIPHHGDLKSFCKNMFHEMICPISHGGNNNYGHPSAQVISDLRNDGNRPVYITDNLGSYYVQEIDNR